MNPIDTSSRRTRSTAARDERRWIRSPLFVALCLLLSLSQQVQGQEGRVLTVADTLIGGVGGVAVDRLGDIYVADFGETVWKIKPDGRVMKFAEGLYGTSGNTVDRYGNLYQANFYGNFITKIDRVGNQTMVVQEGLNGPVGVAMAADGTLYINNCRSNTVSKVAADGTTTAFATGDLFNCPNGITIGPQGDLYVVNFSDGKMLRINQQGEAATFAVIPGGGNGHVAFARGAFYVTSFQSHRVYRVSLEGKVDLFAGTGVIGEADGPALEATFIFPNGIAANPLGDRLYINDFINRFPPTIDRPPIPLSSLRMLKLASLSEIMAATLQAEGLEKMVEAYRNFKSDPSTAGLFTQIEVNVLGYQLMGADQLPAATEVFKLNVESYPNAFNTYDSLAEAYMNAGKNKLAIEFYKKSLALNPANTNATQMLAKLEAQ